MYMYIYIYIYLYIYIYIHIYIYEEYTATLIYLEYTATLYTATLISSVAQCPMSFRLLPSSVTTFILT